MRDPSRTVVLVARAPLLGTVKTRLAAEIGAEAALDAYRDLGRRVGRAVAALDCRRVVAFTPDDAESVMRRWLGDAFDYQPQASGDLGDRMAAVVAAQWAAGTDQVVLVGTDCPTVDQGTIEAAFTSLSAGAAAVLGPADDGGYYLIGVSRRAARAVGVGAGALSTALFDGVPWSRADTLATTVARLRARGVPVTFLTAMRDVDTADDWRAWLASGAGAG